MELNNISIRKATKQDATFIADAIMQAVGDEITLDFAGSEERIPLVKKLFTVLAKCDDSQYSYKNTLIAETQAKDVCGVLIGYDGAGLHGLRERFIENANRILGYNITADGMSDETDATEFYLDSLSVFKPYRRKGIASLLIKTMIEWNRGLGKPFGLLVDKDNRIARTVYENLGFRKVGERPFAGVMMDHLQMD